MSTLIVYETKHGCTEKCANKLDEQLKDETTIVNLKDPNKDFDLSKFDNIVIGGSIHAGNVQKRVKTFCQKNAQLLKGKKLGLFLCCMEQDEEKAQQQFKNAFPHDLIAHASSTGMFGGEFTFERMNFIERKIIKRIAKLDKSVSKISDDAIQKFAHSMN
jgi:menaquinone-dependent protoporphyrinogen oxidase